MHAAALAAAIVVAANVPVPPPPPPPLAATPTSEAPTARERAAAQQLCRDFQASKEDFPGCVRAMLRNNPERRAYGDAYGWAHLAIDPSGWTVRAAAADKVNLSRGALGPAPWSPRAWLRTENQEPGADAYLSAVWLYEFDCLGQRMRNLQSTTYAGHNLSGEAKTVTLDMPKWEYPNPDSIGDVLMQELCRGVLAQG